MKEIRIGKVEKRLLDFIQKNISYIVLLFVLLIGLLMRYKMFPFSSSDYTSYVLPWYDELKEAGGLKGFKYYSGNYNYAYITILALLTYLPVEGFVSIKVVHVLFDVFMAVIAAKIATFLCAEKDGNKKSFTFEVVFTLVFLSPLVMLNSSLWGQCDVIYASFCLLSILLLLEGKHAWCFFFYGIALAFKLQAVFILPLFVLVYLINKKFSVLNIVFIPVGIFVASLPGMAFSGKWVTGFLNTYKGQMGLEDMLVQNYPNIYYWISAQHYELFLFLGIAFVLAGFVLVAGYLMKRGIFLSNTDIVFLGFWCIMFIMIFCPKMHERYGYVAEVLALLLMVVKKKMAGYSLTIQTLVLFSYFAVLFGYYLYLFQNMALLNLILFLAFTFFFFKSLRTKTELSE